MTDDEFDKEHPYFNSKSVKELIDAHDDYDLVSEDEFFNNLNKDNGSKR
jgi:hypothetical protein